MSYLVNEKESAKTFITPEAPMDTVKKWHLRHGQINLNDLLELQIRNMVLGLKEKLEYTDLKCKL